MSPDPASLERLHDIVGPMPAPWWPPAPGWLWLLGMVAVVAVVMLVRGIIRRQQRRYRREALAELTRLTSASGNTVPADAIAVALAALLKRTALTAYPRETVAPLTGPDWFAFLDRTGGTRFADGLGTSLERSIYHPGDGALDQAKLSELIGETRAWIRNHHATLPVAAAEPGDPFAAADARRAA